MARFMNLAESSLEECPYYLSLAHHLTHGDTDQLVALLEKVSKMLNAFVGRQATGRSTLL